MMRPLDLSDAFGFGETFMLKHVLAAAAVVLVASTAHATEVMATPQACYATVDELAQAWENHKYASKAESEKIGVALSALEKLCEGNLLADAQKTAAELKAQIVK
jgi:hypothetical protein